MLAALALVISLAAQPFIFSGRVADSMDAPLDGASIAAICDGAALPPAASDAAGRFSIALPPGRCTVTIAF